MKLSVAQLRAILRAHDILEVGSKDELIARVGLLKAGHQEAAFSRERLCILHLIATAKEISRNQAASISQYHRTRSFAHGNTETLTTRTSCVQGLLRHNKPTIDENSSMRDPQSVFAILETRLKEQEEKSRLNVLEERVINPIKKEKLGAKFSKCGRNEFMENERRSCQQNYKIVVIHLIF